MNTEILTRTDEQLGSEDYTEISPGVYVRADDGAVLVMSNDDQDTGLLISR